MPLTLPTLQDPATGLVFSIGAASYGISVNAVPETSIRFASPLKAGDTSLVPYTGAFLATVKSKDGSKYTTVPSLQQYMPKAENGVNYWVNNFRVAAASGAPDGLLYLKGYYTVPTAPLAAAVKEHGYDTEFSGADRMTQYIYQASTTSANVVDSDGNPVKVNPDRTAPYVGLRQVIDGHDAEVAVGGKFDPVGNLGLVVNDHAGNPITLPSDDVKIDISKVNTGANGTYPVTVTYAPDGVSNTFYVKVGTGTTGGGGGGETGNTVTPKAPSQGADQVTIPTVPGVDYQVDGKTVTGTITLNDGQKITVTAKAQDGYTLTEGATATWDFTYNKGTTPTCDTQYFTDVTPNMQFFNDICWLKANNITTGWPDGTYRPVTPINRDAMIAYIYRMAGSPAFTPTKQTFSDVAPSNMYYKEIEWAAHEGITTGWPDGTLRPVTPVSRDAMAAFLYRQSGSPAVALPASPSFHDVPADNMYYKDIEWMASTAISTGWPDGTYRPLADTNRDAMAAFIHRAVTAGVLTVK
ncbi:surface layer protein F (S-layer protein F) [Propionibacterium freudenreichii subsp. freudenreichii]|uniref:Surface layer protein F (S-layer protein F) n=1 Tax=Propionibacterium freudenreichii subsp. freudenreichii TaxID=66712 RepID=A0A0B7NZP5_PROFF|nr:surface layer protein F (S-layer protein F) [Propionibacterium freudenreichii subsp. freudenreichii]